MRLSARMSISFHCAFSSLWEVELVQPLWYPDVVLGHLWTDVHKSHQQHLGHLCPGWSFKNELSAGELLGRTTVTNHIMPTTPWNPANNITMVVWRPSSGTLLSPRVVWHALRNANNDMPALWLIHPPPVDIPTLLHLPPVDTPVLAIIFVACGAADDMAGSLNAHIPQGGEGQGMSLRWWWWSKCICTSWALGGTCGW